MTPLGGAILSGQDTLIRAIHPNVNGPVSSLTDIWGFHRIEDTGQPGYENEEINTLTNSPSNSLLIPFVGSNLNMYIDSGNVVTESLVNGSNSNGNYNITARIHENVPTVNPNAKTTSPDDSIKDTSGTVTDKTLAL